MDGGLVRRLEAPCRCRNRVRGDRATNVHLLLSTGCTIFNHSRFLSRPAEGGFAASQPFRLLAEGLQAPSALVAHLAATDRAGAVRYCTSPVGRDEPSCNVETHVDRAAKRH